MIVRELIEKLQKCSPDSTVFVEANNIPNAKVVQEYKNTKTGETMVYIADETDYIDDVINEEYKKI